jgi:exosome complex component RRP40
MQYVVPGDQVFKLPESGVVRVGTGLRDDGTQLVASRPGLLQQSKNGKLWVFGRQKRYIPSVDDAVLGVVTSKFSEYYEIDIAAPFSALLPVLAFEGATRRNRPNLKEGDLVYCRVDMADRDLQPTVTCMDGAGRGAGFGLLSGGYVLECSTAYSRILVAKPPPPVLAALGRSLQFELAVGVNGRVWIAAPTQQATIVVAQVLEECEREPREERVEAIVADRVKTYQRSVKERDAERLMQE